MSEKTRLLTFATIVLRKGQPLPVDLQTDLLALGVDVAALERRHAP